MKALVLGYSVTAEGPGYVEHASGSLSRAGVSVEKIGLGGFQPRSAVHLFVPEIHRRQPSVVVLEQSTPAFRLYSKDREAYALWVRAVLQASVRVGARFCFLDLPRRDVDVTDDWVTALHAGFADRLGAGQVVHALDTDLLRDEVHPTEAGRRVYAASLIRAIEAARRLQAGPEDFADVPQYGCRPLAEMMAAPPHGTRAFARGGFVTEMVNVPAGETIELAFDQPLHLAGYVGLCGPQSGAMQVALDGAARRVMMHDRHAYYERAMSYPAFSPPQGCRRISFRQEAELPDVELLKGERSHQPRMGGVSHLLVRHPPAYHKGQMPMSLDKGFKENAVARGFLVFPTSRETAERFSGGPFAPVLQDWQKTFFGPYQVWSDSRLNYATARDERHGVAVLGLCLNPFDGAAGNGKIAENLYAALTSGEGAFLDYVDQLSGSFVILYRVNAQVRILQDCAATKPVYYFCDADRGTVAASHAGLIGQTFWMERDPRIARIFGDEAYKKDPSRYLPGDITPFVGLKGLTANTVLLMESGKARRFFPREPLAARGVDDALVEEISGVFLRQAEMLAATGRPLRVAATAGRDSRVSVAAFARFDTAKLFSFHFPRTGRLSEDVETSRTLAHLTGQELEIYDLSQYSDAAFNPAFKMTSPVGIWASAALCYIQEFPQNAIHIRSTVSEIGRMFYSRRTASQVSPEALARAYTVTDFWDSGLVVQAMAGFIKQAEFQEDRFFNYSLYDMFYWEHRNSKWQNILCQEAEMATDVFIPYNNRRLICLFLAVPESDRKAARLHVEVAKRLEPAFAGVPYIS